jgi:hypothetical protein
MHRMFRVRKTRRGRRTRREVNSLTGSQATQRFRARNPNHGPRLRRSMNRSLARNHAPAANLDQPNRTAEEQEGEFVVAMNTSIFVPPLT